jgi:hypothetical protein
MSFVLIIPAIYLLLGLLEISPRTVTNYQRYVRNCMEATTTSQAILAALISGEFRPGKGS